MAMNAFDAAEKNGIVEELHGQVSSRRIRRTRARTAALPQLPPSCDLLFRVEANRKRGTVTNSRLQVCRRHRCLGPGTLQEHVLLDKGLDMGAQVIEIAILVGVDFFSLER